MTNSTTTAAELFVIIFFVLIIVIATRSSRRFDFILPLAKAGRWITGFFLASFLLLYVPAQHWGLLPKWGRPADQSNSKFQLDSVESMNEDPNKDLRHVDVVPSQMAPTNHRNANTETTADAPTNELSIQERE